MASLPRRAAALLLLVAIGCGAARPVVAASVPLPTADLGDFDPAAVTLVGALAHAGGVPAGPLRAITDDGSGTFIHFAGLIVSLPERHAERATALPLVRDLLDHRVDRSLIPESAVTYAALAAVPSSAAATPPPLVLPFGDVAPLPADAVPPAFVNMTLTRVDGFGVPDIFRPFTTADTPTAGVEGQARGLLLAGAPLGGAVWVRAGTGMRLVQPFARRILVWDPTTGNVRGADVGDAAVAAGLAPDGGIAGRMLARITERLAAVPDDGIGVALLVTTPYGAITTSWGGTTRYPSASVIKVAILAAYEDAVARGDVPRTTEVDDLETAMIVDSDNDAANALIDLVGRAQINALIRRLGLTQSYLGSHFDTATEDDDDDNMIVPREALTLMAAALHGDVGNGGRIHELLGQSHAPGDVRDALPNLDRTFPLYEKRGWYDGVENDLLQLDLGPGLSITLAVCQSAVSDIDAAWALFSDLLLIALDALQA